MTIQRRIDKEHLITTYISGHISLPQLFKSVLQSSQLTDDCTEYWELMLMDQDQLIINFHDRIRLEAVHAAKEMIQFRTQGAIAIVISSPASRKLGDHFAALLRGDVVPVTVFDDEAAARKWLSIHMECGTCEATALMLPARSKRTALHHPAPGS